MFFNFYGNELEADPTNFKFNYETFSLALTLSINEEDNFDILERVFKVFFYYDVQQQSIINNECISFNCQSRLINSCSSAFS